MRRHELADLAGALRPADDDWPNQAADQCSPRFVVAVMTPTNHRTAHPWSAASVTTTPRFMRILGGVQHLLGELDDADPGTSAEAERIEELRGRIEILMEEIDSSLGIEPAPIAG